MKKIDEYRERIENRKKEEEDNQILRDPITNEVLSVTELRGKGYLDRHINIIKGVQRDSGPCGFIQKEIYEELKGVRYGSPEEKTREQDESFCQYNNGLMQTGKLLNALSNSELRILLYLNASVFRAPSKKDKHNLYQDYFLKQNLLAACQAYSTIRECCGIKSNMTVKTAIDGMIEKEYLYVETSKIENQNIYILGFVDVKTGKEVRFIDRELRRRSK